MNRPQTVVVGVAVLLLVFAGLDLTEGDFSAAAISLFLVAASLIVWEVLPAPWRLKKDQEQSSARKRPPPPFGTFRALFNRRLAIYEATRALDKRLPLKVLIGIFAVSMILNVLGVAMLASPIGGYVLLVGFAGTVLICLLVAIGLWTAK